MNNELKKYRIASIEAQDLINAEKTDKRNGYTLKDENKEWNYRRFNNILPQSLDSLQIFKEYFRIYRNKKFAFTNPKESLEEILYTEKIINVKFSVCLKEYIKKYDGVYLKEGCELPKDFKNKDVEVDEDGVPLFIRIEKHIKDPKPINSEYFELKEELVDGETKYFYTIIKSPKTSESTKELRKRLYRDGCLIDGERYVRYKRSSGASREGHCLFILESLSKAMNKWSKCGLEFKEKSKIDLSSYEAYQSLSLSSIIDTVTLKKENFLFIKDCKCTLKNRKMMKLIKNSNTSLDAYEMEGDVENNIWDGEALMDKSVFDSVDKIRGKGMALLRGRFFKTCAFNTNLSDWFRENGITEISSLNGVTFAKSIDQIKIVVTDSSVKYLKFKDYANVKKEGLSDDEFRSKVLERFLDEHGNLFGIVKTEKKTSFFDGLMVMTSYQLLNTIRLEKNDVDSFLKDSYDYLKKIKTDPKYLRFYLNYSRNYSYDDDFVEELSDRNTKSAREFKNDIVYKLLGINENFRKTELCKDFITEIDGSYKKKIRNGHVLVHGTNATLFGNGYELLLETINRFDRNNPVSLFSEFEIYSSMFDDSKTILGARSPHVTMGNLLIAKNREIDEYKKWFNLTREIVCVDAINTNIQQMLNGCDYDSDTMLLTDNECLIEHAIPYFQKFLIPVNPLDPIDKKDVMTPENLSILDYNISNNLVGQIINLSQELNSILWDKINKGKDVDDMEIKDIYKNISILSCLSGMEIDKAKRDYEVKTNSILDKIRAIRDKYNEGKNRKPIFFENLSNKGRTKDRKIEYVPLNTTMDNIQKSVDEEGRKQRSGKHISSMKLIDLFKYEVPVHADTNITYRRRTIDDIKEIIDETYEKRNKLFINIEGKDDNAKAIKTEEASRILVDGINELKKKLDNEYVCYELLKELSENRIGKIKWLMMYAFFNSKGSAFANLIKSSIEEISILKIDENEEKMDFDSESSEIIHNIHLKESKVKLDIGCFFTKIE